MESAGRQHPRPQRELVSEVLSDVHSMSGPEQSSSLRRLLQKAEQRRTRKRRAGIVRNGIIVLGLLLIVAGIAVIAVPLWGVHQRGEADSQALNDWNHGGAQALAGPVGAVAAPAACSATAAPPDDYALVAFPSLTAYNYAGVAGDGTWDQLHQRSMVHYQGSAAPGGQGNDIIAFHREPNFQHIDELKEGDIVSVQDRSCHVFRYQISQKWQLSPDSVTQLGPTEGHDLTLITCTPWYIDNDRLVWRATLLPESTPSPSAATKS